MTLGTLRQEEMGSKYTFECPKCGATEFSSEGRDCGFVAVVQPMLCDDCNKLVEVLIGRMGQDGPTGDPEYDKDLNICPECRGKNLRIWPSNHPCLNCGTSMEISEDGLALLWD